MSWHVKIIWNSHFSIHKWNFIETQPPFFDTTAEVSSYDRDCASTIWPLAESLLTTVLDQCFPTCQVSVLIFEKGLVIKSVWEMLGQFLNCRTSQGLQHADIKQCLLGSCDLGTFGGRYKVPQESTLWEAMNFWETPCRGLQWSPRPTWGPDTKPSPRDTASSLPSGHATPADEGPAHFTTQCPFYRGALRSARIHSSSLELIVCLFVFYRHVNFILLDFPPCFGC